MPKRPQILPTILTRHLTQWTMVLCVITLMACGAAEKKKVYKLPGATDFVVGNVTIEGVNKLDLSKLEAGIVTQEDPGWRADISGVPILGAPRSYFNYIEWERDLTRIITHYHANGYFDARIATKNVVQDAKEKRVRLKISIFEGEATKVSEINLFGIEDPEVQAGLMKALKMAIGERFEQERYLNAKNALVLELRRRSYAYAQVRGRVNVDVQEHTASVDFFLDTGPKSVFGVTKVEGLDRVDEKYIRTAITFKEGEPFNPERLKETQEEIYALRAFTVVKIESQQESRVSQDMEPPAPEDAEEGLGISSILDDAQDAAETRSSLDPIVPITIRIKEAKAWNLRVGVEAEVEVNRQSVQARLDWSNPNIFGGLQRVEHLNAVGYAWAPTVFEPVNEGLLVDSELRFTQPQFLERRTLLKSSVRFQRDVYQGYNIISPSFRLGLARPFFGNHLAIEFSYNFSLNKLTEIDASLIGSDVFVEDYILEYFEQRIRLDFRNEVLNPSRGWMIELIAQEAMQIFWVGERDYFKPTLAAEFYIPTLLGTNQVFAGRARLGSTYSYGRPGGVPIDEKIYSGGIDSMRSFGRQEISYWTNTGDAFPIGASSQLELSLESRWRVVRNLLGVGDLWLAGFVDAASVQKGQLFYDTSTNVYGLTSLGELASTLVYGLGVGTYWVTPIGPLRIDFAYTLSDITEDERFRRCTTEVLTCDPSLWVPLEDDPIQKRITGYSFFFGIGHSF